MNLQNKNILLVIHYGIMGGAERQGLGISKFLTNNNNCNVDVLLTFSGEMTSDFKNFANECNVRNIYHFGESYLVLKKELTYKNLKRCVWSIKYLLRLRKGLIKNNYDVVMPFLNFPSKVSYYLYKLLPTVKFTFWHQLGLDTMSLDIFEFIAAKNTPCVIGNATNCLDMFKTTYKVNPKKLNVLPQYVSMKYIKSDNQLLRIKYDIPQESLVIGMIAHFRPEKYFELLLNTFEKLSSKYNNIHLVLLGSKNSSEVTYKKFNHLNNIINQKKLAQKVSLLSDIKAEDVLNTIDIGVLVSEIEGMPNVVMEYMLFGLPAVATNHPGCVTLLEDSSFLIENNENQLLAALDNLILSKELRDLEGKSNLNKIKKYNMDAYVEKLEIIMNMYL